MSLAVPINEWNFSKLLQVDVDVGSAAVYGKSGGVSLSYQPTENKISFSYSPALVAEQDSSVSAAEQNQPASTPAMGGYVAVPINEPDLSKVPSRSALKGAKSRQLEKLSDKQRVQNDSEARLSGSSISSTGSGISGIVQFGDDDGTGHRRDSVKVPPKVAPKPKVVV